MGHLDIDIPPPRPKRKPSSPYPRKTGVSPTPCQVALKDGKLPSPVSLSHCKQVLDLEKEPIPEKANGEEEKQTNAKGKQVDSSSEVLSLLHDPQCSSVSSMNKNSLPKPEELRNPCSFRELVPPMKNRARQDASTEYYVTNVLEGNQKLDKPEAKQTVQHNGTGNASKSESCSALPTDEMEGVHNYPRHIPVHVLDGRLMGCVQTPSDVTFQDPIFHPVGEVNGHPSFYSATSATAEHQNNEPRSCAQSFLNFPPALTSDHHNQDVYRSFLHVSSTFSNLIVSTLLQNPAAHAAATFAATFWPYANLETSGDSPACVQGRFLPRQMNPSPSMAAIAAATVAAATAWWAAHGLLPLCAPPFTCHPNSTTAVPSADAGQVAATKTDETARENLPFQDQQLDLPKSEALQAQNSASKSPTLSLSDFEESTDPKQTTGPKATDHELEAAAAEIHDLGKANRKQVDRSSCGSNTSGSEAEIDAPEKLKKDKEESKEADTNHTSSESNSRRRSSSNISDPWKEVSEEGRLAFQALFSREILPQSFSPPHDLKIGVDQYNDIEVEQQNDDKDETASLLNLNSNTRLHCNHHEVEKSMLPTVDYANSEEEVPLTIGLGHGKLKARRTGFKPYKRCSVEAKENRMVTSSIQGEEKCPKRIRVEGESST